MAAGIPNRRTSTGQHVTGNGTLLGITLKGGSDAATALFYDNTTNAGTVIADLAAAAGATVVLNVPIHFRTGVYVVLTGTGPSTVVYA